MISSAVRLANNRRAPRANRLAIVRAAKRLEHVQEWAVRACEVNYRRFAFFLELTQDVSQLFEEIRHDVL